LTLHPLAKYPGPFLAKITDWYGVYHAWKGDRHLEFWRTHEKYGKLGHDSQKKSVMGWLTDIGKFVRFGPNSLSINSNTALQKIYGHGSNVRKSQFYSVFPPTKDTFNTHSSIDKASHARKRRVLSHAFSDTAVKQMEKYILGNIRTFCEGIGGGPVNLAETKGWSAPQNMADWCNYLTFDIMGDLCFGKAFGMLERPDNRFAIQLIGNAAHRHLICGTLPMIHEYHLDKVLFRKISTGRERYMKYSKAQSAERTKMGSDVDRKDFFYHLLKAKDPETGKGFTVPELWGESNLLIIAGSDTTSTALASSFFYLVHNAHALAKITAEVRAAFENIEDIVAGPTLSACAYLRACIDEGMRLSPPVGGLLPREIQEGGMVIDGEDLPAGVVVGTPHYTVHHNADYYPDPFSYVPERWIASSTAPSGTVFTSDSVSVARSAFCPFSIGPRGCIGKGMAYTELGMALARVVWLYDMRLASGMKVGEGSRDLEWGRQREGEFQLMDCFTSMKEGPMVEFRRREV
jgi:cytochrome P450